MCAPNTQIVFTKFMENGYDENKYVFQNLLHQNKLIF